ncbi:hypothetical protein L0P96_15450 [Anoxybacillus flavithermus]
MNRLAHHQGIHKFLTMLGLGAAARQKKSGERSLVKPRKRPTEPKAFDEDVHARRTEKAKGVGGC